MKRWLLTMVLLTTLFVSKGNCTCGCFEIFIPYDYASVDDFHFHMVTRYINNSINSVADPVYGSYSTWDVYKDTKTRYYHNTNCENTEPPSTNPQIYDWSSNEIPVIPAPNWNSNPAYYDNCEHPPIPPMIEEDIQNKYTKDAMIFNPFRLHKIGLGYYADIVESNKRSAGDDGFWNTIRNNDTENPGNYFEFPQGAYVETDSTDKTFLDNLLSRYMASEYYNKAILDSIDNWYLADLNRKEFYFEATINNTRFRFSGWYGKFAHIFVLTEFNSKKSFIEKVKRFFNIPPLEPQKILYDEETVQDRWNDFFYTYDNSDINFKLFGYPNLKMIVMDDSVNCFIDGEILDLTVYPEEE